MMIATTTKRPRFENDKSFALADGGRSASRRRRKVAVERREDETAAAIVAAVRLAMKSALWSASPATADLNRHFLDAITATIVPQIDPRILVNAQAPRDFSLLLLQRSLERVEKVLTAGGEGDAPRRATTAAAMQDVCGNMPPHSVVASPVLKYVGNEGQLATACRLGSWLGDGADDALMWWRRQQDDSAASAACNVRTDRLPASGEALVTDLLARRVRLLHLTQHARVVTAAPEAEITTAAAASDDAAAADEQQQMLRRLFSPLRTQMYCRYDLLSCVALNTLHQLTTRFREHFVQSLDSALRQAQVLEQEAAQTLAQVRARSAELESAIRTEQEALATAREQENNLRDESKALYVSLANVEAELRNRTQVVLVRMSTEVEKRLMQDPTLAELQQQHDSAVVLRDRLVAEATERAQPVCRLLAKLSRQTVEPSSSTLSSTVISPQPPAIPKSGAACRNLALENRERLQRAAQMCESSGLLMCTAAKCVEAETNQLNLDEVDAIVQNCEPLRKLNTHHLFAERQNLRAEEERRERLTRVRQKHKVNLKEYGQNMRRYLQWLRCFESTLANPTWSVSATDSEVRRAVAAANRLGGSSATTTNWTSSVEYHMQRMVALAMPSRTATARLQDRANRGDAGVWQDVDFHPPPPSSRRRGANEVAAAARTACVVHSLVADLREEGCRLPTAAVYRELLTRGGADDPPNVIEGTVNALTQRAFRWPLGISEMDKRGLAFAMLVAVCPEDGLLPSDGGVHQPSSSRGRRRDVSANVR